MENLLDGVGFCSSNDQHQPNAHVEYSFHLVVGNVAQTLQPAEDRRDGPTVALNLDAHVGGKDSPEVFPQAAARDMRDSSHNLLAAIL